METKQYNGLIYYELINAEDEANAGRPELRTTLIVTALLYNISA